MIGLRILAVDDDPVTLALLEKNLPNGGHRLDTLHDGAAALKRLKEVSYDVVITDLIMPGDVDGLDVLKKTRFLQPEAEVLLLTAHASVDSAVEAMKQGAFDYLQKPINFDELHLILERIRELRQLGRQRDELRQAMEITEHNAAETIGRLEMEVARLQAVLEEISGCLQQTGIRDAEKLGQVAHLLSATGPPRRSRIHFSADFPPPRKPRPGRRKPADSKYSRSGSKPFR